MEALLNELKNALEQAVAKIKAGKVICNPFSEQQMIETLQENYQEVLTKTGSENAEKIILQEINFLKSL
jgi:TRAP-type mannitol/chloroaromatic compound transport system substrate-binding protein